MHVMSGARDFVMRKISVMREFQRFSFCVKHEARQNYRNANNADSVKIHQFSKGMSVVVIRDACATFPF